MRIVIGGLLLLISTLAVGRGLEPNGSLVVTQSSWQHQNTQYLVKPASLMKLVTATAALSQLGADFHFNTVLEINAFSSSQADIRLIFQGDPTLTLTQLQTLLSHLKQAGIRSVRHFYIDDSIYSGHPWGIGQVWNDHGICFAAPVSAIMVNRNCILGNLKPTQSGQLTRLHTQNYAGVSFDNQVITGDVGQLKCEPLLMATSHNHFVLTGCLPKQNGVMPLAFSVMDPRLYIQAIVTKYFKQNEISWSHQLMFNKGHLARVTQQWSNQSKPLSELLKEMLKHSDNLIADSLFKRLGVAVDDSQSGSYQSGAEAVWQILAKYGIQKSNQILMDGSGLSRENLLYADTLYKVLQLWQNHVRFRPLIDDLPVAGVDGTLRYRHALLKKPFVSHVFAKTGSMAGVANLAGYIQKAHQLRPFVMLASQLADTDPKLSSTELIQIFEQNFLQSGFNALPTVK
ncbi:D-alanyl-D-alanine carboxypeptidase/D-alanyl-D-alanine-endopeptidase [Celerinatantimonas sp. YJH-8]|uniref:D-alanyl-D-alanine carboxypeptidase/D-alanyl-D-alanine endopeptidase n=1 Tax=Celerinatantimonas sp. YJH-8 TaxID=3228714 RepID=UPI0038CA3969